MGDQVLPEHFSIHVKQCARNDRNFSENSFCTTTMLLHTLSTLHGHFLKKKKKMYIYIYIQLFHTNPTALLSLQQNSWCSFEKMLVCVNRRSTRKNYTACTQNYFKITVQNAGKNRNTLWITVLLQEGSTSEAMFNKIYVVHIEFYYISVKNFWTHLVNDCHIKETTEHDPHNSSKMSTYRGYQSYPWTCHKYIWGRGAELSFLIQY